MKIKVYAFYLFTIIFFSSCSNDSTDDLIDSNLSQNVTYNSTVKNIIDNNCIQCHGTTPTNGATLSLTTYENVKNAILTLSLFERISSSEGSSGAMPDGGPRLPQTSINLIEQWKNEGLAE
ncbi:hypothetical protein [Flavobacterium sp.]|uniref:hypothetical protein n=1 Tax=Flavobacterium sp. TaxID=239 RepID=UPI0037524835